jgi:hypothetical protein
MAAEFICRLSCLRQQSTERSAQRGQAAFNHPPHEAVVYAGIPMNEHIAKGDDTWEL